jgi:hypothetical protein
MLLALGETKMLKMLAVILIAVGFSLGVLADETIKPTGWSWQKVVSARQLGYVEGFNAGIMNEMEQRFCGETKILSLCVLYNLRQHTLLDVGTAQTLSTMSAFYATPANLPVRWSHALVISAALASGVPITESDLQVIRAEDARVAVKYLEY